MGKWFTGFMVFVVCVGLMLAMMGQPAGASGETSWSFGGTTLMDVFANRDAERTERIRIQEAQATQRVAIEQAEETQRNKDFWQNAPQIAWALAALAAAVGLSLFGVAWAKNRPSAPGTAIVPVTNNYYTYRADRTSNTWQTYNAPAQTVVNLPPDSQHDYSKGLPALPGAENARRLTVRR